MILLKTIISQEATSRVLGRDSNIFVHPNIPRDKLAGAMNYIDSSVRPEDVVLLLDDTVFGSAKDGLVLTETTLYVHEKFCEPAEYDFADISAISVRNEFLSNVLYIDNVRVAALSQPSKDTLIALCLIINTYLKQFQGKTKPSNHSNMGHGSTPKSSSDTSDHLRTFEICMLTAEIMTHFALLDGNQWRHDKLQIINDTITAFRNYPYLHDLIQQRLFTAERSALDQSVDYLMRHEPPDEVKIELMWHAFQIMAQDESDLMKVENRMRQFALLLNVFPAPLNEFCQALRERFDYGNNRQQTGNTDITWACQILGVNAHHPTLDAIQQAYRIKIKDFHPDKHQSLPESVRQLVESKTQELNQAREILLAYFTETSTSV